MSPRQQNHGDRTFDFSKAQCLLQRTGAALVLSAQLIILGELRALRKPKMIRGHVKLFPPAALNGRRSLATFRKDRPRSGKV
jgi:hypothetical protein